LKRGVASRALLLLLLLLPLWLLSPNCIVS
jgi:hypothetical protein